VCAVVVFHGADASTLCRMEIQNKKLEREFRLAIKEMNADPRMLGRPLDTDPPDIAIARIAQATRGTLESVTAWARIELDFDQAEGETDYDRNTRVARNNAVLRSVGEWSDRAVKSAEIQAKLGLSQIKAGIAVEHLSLAKLSELRALSSNNDVSEKMAALATSLRHVIAGGDEDVLEGEVVEDD